MRYQGTAGRWQALACVLKVLLVLEVTAAPAAGATAVCKSDGSQERCLLILPVTLNGVAATTLPREGIVMYREGTTYFLERDHFVALGLRPPTTAAFEEDGKAYFALAPAPVLSAEVHADAQELAIQAAAVAFALFRSTMAARDAQTGLTHTGNGFFVNYDATVQGHQRVNALAQAELNWFSRWGTITSTVLHNSAMNQRVARLATTYIFDLPRRRQSLRIGDNLTQTGSWGRSLYFGGVQWGTAFETQPEFVRFPLPSIRGEALTPSVAELYVNQSLRWTSQVPAGAFEIVSPPLISGPGQVQLVVTDALGRRSIQTESYFATPRLLGQGVVDFSVSVGLARHSLGERFNAYARPLATGYYRRGLTARLTAEARTEVTGELLAAGAHATVRVLGPLLISGAAVHSEHARAGSGDSWQGSVDLQTLRFGAGAQVRQSTRGFRQLGLDRLLLPERKFQSVYLSWNLFRRDHLNVSLFSRDAVMRNDFVSGSYTLSLRRGLAFIASCNMSLRGSRSSVMTAGLSFELKERTSASVAAVASRDGNGVRASVQRNLPFGEGYGYQVTGQSGPHQQLNASMIRRGSSSELQVAVDSTPMGTGVQATVRGAIGVMSGAVFHSRRIDDGFAVVRVGEYAGVRVLSDNQPISVTNRRGVAIIPRLLSFQANRIAILPGDLPIDVELETVEVEARPGRRRGISLDFPVKSNASLLLHLVDRHGVPIPAGARLRVLPGGEEMTVGLRGLVYLRASFEQALTLEVTWKDQSCRAEYLPSQHAEELTCR